MMTHASKKPVEARADHEVAPAPQPKGPERLQWLFRDALRQQRVHPLMDQVSHYRAKSPS
jgi:hypothetical protein